MLLWAVVSGFALALVAPFVRPVTRDLTAWVLAALPAALFVYFTGFLGAISDGEVIRESTPWVPIFDGIPLSFMVDGLSLLFALLITGIGVFIVLYAGAYLKGHANLGRFLGFLLAFMASMLGLVLADNVITFFVFWEMTSVTSFLLIGFSHQRPASRRAAVQALIVTGGGGLVMLAGLVLMAAIGGSFEFSVLLAQGDLYREHALYGALLVLILAGAFTKSAQVPFHFWLPNAMEAPTPVSAYLHSATMVKAGVYLLARVYPALSGTAAWEMTLGVFGGVTFLTGTVLAIRQTDLKLMLAYTTVASLGLLVFLLGLGSDKAVIAAMAYLFAHSLFKGALFMVAGGIDSATGTRDSTVLGGLATAMPITALAGAIAVLSMAGVPPLIGFLAKEVIYKATLADNLAGLMTAVAVAGNILMGAVAGLAGVRPFLGRRLSTPKAPKEGTPSLWLGALVLGVLSLASALDLHWTQEHILKPATEAVAGTSVKVDLHLWAGINMPLILSVATLVGALLIYLNGRTVGGVVHSLTASLWGPDRGYDQALFAVRQGARGLMGWLQNGDLRSYMFVVFLVLAVLLGGPLVTGTFNVDALLGAVLASPPGDFATTGIMAVGACGALAMAIVKNRLYAVLFSGVLGGAVGLVFLIYSGPDLAFTQFMVETLSVVILTLVLLYLPLEGRNGRGTFTRLRDGVIALTVGLGIAAMLITITSGPLDLRLTEYFNATSYVEAYGRNIVNVILVDFRALDTLGEISVVMIAGVSALALLYAGTSAGRKTGSAGTDGASSHEDYR